MKRFLDIIFSLLALIILSPLLALIALVILVSDGHPVVFKQLRVGKNDKLFRIRKFRTMRRDTPNVAKKDLSVDYSTYVTRVGRFLRKTSLDELPQLVNILGGTMSFVGPRPLIPSEKHIRELRREYDVYSVLPGVTGWAQVMGRDFITDEEKASLDREYIKNKSIAFDIKILFKTIGVVLRRENLQDDRKK